MTSTVLETVVGWALLSTLVVTPVALAAWFLARGEE
jgi:hypothetical protein